MANYQQHRVSQPSSVLSQPVVYAKELMQNRVWAELGDRRFLLEKRNRIFLFHLKPRPVYTLADLNEMPENAPFELLNGRLVFLPIPSDTHQKISIRLAVRLGQFVEENDLGEVLAAPFTVSLNLKNGPQPDLLFVKKSRTSLFEKHGLHGSPDLIVEITSKLTARKDLTTKKDIYGRFGVAEYWIVSPEKKTVQVFEIRENELHSVAEFGVADTLKSTLLPGFELKIDGVF